MKTLIFIPTYNERNNVPPITEKILRLDLPVDLLFVDDDSPDGTGALLDELAARHDNLKVLHRKAKDGIGSAHQAGIAWAIENGYDRVVTMDCDLTHSPEDIPAMLEASSSADVVVGSRYMRPGSLEGWNWRRKLLTRLAHLLTRLLLGLPYDCTGAFRVYRLDRLPRGIFPLVRSKTYPFFFESLFVLHTNGAAIVQVPISLPPRTYGSSKMPPSEPFRGICHLFETATLRLVSPEVFRVPTGRIEHNPSLTDSQGWDDYWSQASQTGNLAYKIIASFYRRWVIARRLDAEIRQTFRPGSHLLHAGCGSGQVDVGFQKIMHLTAVDSSFQALETYHRTVPDAAAILHASILELPFEKSTFDGIYNLGVMEHFQPEEIVRILAEFRRVLKPDGRLLLFWPHSRATSVAVLGLWQTVRKKAFGSAKLLHPPEVSLVQSRSWLDALLQQGGFVLESYHFDARDFWVQVVVTARPRPAQGPDRGRPSP